MADSDLTTLATAADVLGVSVADAKLPRLIAAASESIRRYLDRPQLHYGATIVEKLAGYQGQVRLHLGTIPLISVASVVLPDATSLVQDTDYTIESLSEGVLYREEGWPFTGVSVGGVLTGEALTIVATYAGGWVTPAQSGTRTLPYDIEEVCLQAVAAMYRRQGADPLVASESLGDYSVSFREVVDGLVPSGVLSQLSAYRRLHA